MKPLTRMENILLGNEVKPLRRKEFFLEKAAEGGGSSGGIKIVRCTGDIRHSNVNNIDYYELSLDREPSVIQGWIDAGIPVFVQAPTLDLLGNTYVYEESLINLIPRATPGSDVPIIGVTSTADSMFISFQSDSGSVVWQYST